MYFAPCCSALGLSAKVQTTFGSRFSPETAHIERSRQACPMCTPSNAPMVSTVRPDSGRSLSVMIFKKKSSFLSFPPRGARGIGYKHNQNREKQGRKTSFAIAVKQAARPQAGGNGGVPSPSGGPPARTFAPRAFGGALPASEAAGAGFVSFAIRLSQKAGKTAPAQGFGECAFFDKPQGGGKRPLFLSDARAGAARGKTLPTRRFPPSGVCVPPKRSPTGSRFRPARFCRRFSVLRGCRAVRPASFLIAHKMAREG